MAQAKEGHTLAHELEVRNPYDNSIFARVPLADDAAFDRAADAAVAAAPLMARRPALDVGGVIINDVLGREGARYTIEEMTEPKLMVINRTAV